MNKQGCSCLLLLLFFFFSIILGLYASWYKQESHKRFVLSGPLRDKTNELYFAYREERSAWASAMLHVELELSNNHCAHEER